MPSTVKRMMEPFYLRRIKEELAKRVAHNRQYSLRAFARDTKIDQGVLSLIINGKRLPSKKDSQIFPVILDLTPDEHEQFQRSIEESRRMRRIERVNQNFAKTLGSIPDALHVGAQVEVDPKLIPEAKAMIDQFTQSLRSFLEAGDEKQDYELAISLVAKTHHPR